MRTNYWSIVKEMAICNPMFQRFYNREITGSELYYFIMENVQEMKRDYSESFVEFCSQIKKEQLYDSSWTLPKNSSGSFYTGFMDIDFIAEELNEEEFKEIREYWNNI